MEATREIPVTHGPTSSTLHITLREWLLLAVLAGIQFTHTVDFILIMPLGPVFQKEMRLSPGEFGYVVAAYTLSAGLAGLCAARFVDRFDRKKALLVLYTGFIAGTLLCAASSSFVMLLLARTVAGAFGGVAAALVLAIVGDAFADARRATAMGIVMSSFSLALIVGIPAGLQLEEWWSWQIAFVALSGFSACVLLLAIMVLPSLRGHLRGRHVPHISIWRVVAHANHLRAFALTGALVFSSFITGPYQQIYLVRNVGVEQQMLKYVFLCGGIATVVTLPLVGRLADRFGKLLVFRIVATLAMVPTLVLTNLPGGLHLAVVLLVTTLFMILVSARMVPGMALITGSSAPMYRGSFMSLNAAVQHIGAAVASAAGGLLLQAFGSSPVDGVSEVSVGDLGAGEPLSCFWLLGLLACGAMITSVILAGRIRLAAGGTLAPDSAAVTG
jgi:predicted MFS family arabinose efflux permease